MAHARQSVGSLDAVAQLRVPGEVAFVALAEVHGHAATSTSIGDKRNQKPVRADQHIASRQICRAEVGDLSELAVQLQPGWCCTATQHRDLMAAAGEPVGVFECNLGAVPDLVDWFDQPREPHKLLPPAPISSADPRHGLSGNSRIHWQVWRAAPRGLARRGL